MRLRIPRPMRGRSLLSTRKLAPSVRSGLRPSPYLFSLTTTDDPVATVSVLPTRNRLTSCSAMSPPACSAESAEARLARSPTRMTEVRPIAA